MRTGEEKKKVDHPSIVKPRKQPAPIEVPNWPTRKNAPVEVPVGIPIPERAVNV